MTIADRSEHADRSVARDVPSRVEIAVGRKLGGSVALGKARNRTLPWAEFKKFFSAKPEESSESLAEFLQLPRTAKDKLKNANGWWLGGPTIDGHRKRTSIRARGLITFDVEGLKSHGVNVRVDPALIEDLKLRISSLGAYTYLVHSTRKHTKENPRLRVIVPLSRSVDREEYQAVSRYVAQMIDPTLDTIDPVSFRANQLMYMPTLSKGAEYVYIENEEELLDPDVVLAENPGWQNPLDLPYSKHRTPARRSAEAAQDPTEKDNVVGAWCRTYGIDEAIAKFELPYGDRQEQGGEVRYTYLGEGTSGVNGAVVYDNKFLYSHHATDPVSQRLLNAFDLVRLHKFWDLDGEREDDEVVDPTKLKSYKEMVKLATEDEDVVAEFPSESAADLFGDEREDDEESLFCALDNEGNDLEPPKKRRDLIERMNAIHGVVQINNGKAVILTDRKDQPVGFCAEQDLKTLYRNQKVLGPKGQPVPLHTAWLDSPKRRTYTSINFAPGRDLGPNTFNLFRGWSVKPSEEGSCDRFLDHLRGNVCQDDSESCDYLIGWMADLVQHPDRKPGVAVVLRGKKGVGKDVFGEYFAQLFRNNYVKVDKETQFTGRFNAHQEQALLLHVEEGYWAGSHAAESALKSMITSPHTMIEPKGVNPFQVDSFMRILITSNENWVVPATGDERRFFVLEVGDEHRNDHDYFDALMKEGRDGGFEALLHFLKRYKFPRGFDVRRPPATEGLTRQKIAGLRGPDRYLFDLLSSGNLPHPSDGFEEADWGLEPVAVKRDEIMESVRDWWRANNASGSRAPTLHDFTSYLGEALGSDFQKDYRPRVNGKPGPKLYKFPPLSICRDQFAKRRLGSSIDWVGDSDGSEFI